MMESESTFCSRCGRDLEDGSTRYRVRVELTADFDGTIGAAGGRSADERMWQEIEHKSERELLDEVIQELRFVLCKPCRDQWVRALWGDSAPGQDKACGQPH